jgi:hypothetical protein
VSRNSPGTPVTATWKAPARFCAQTYLHSALLNTLLDRRVLSSKRQASQPVSSP